MKKEIINIIKVGGAVVEDETQLSRLLSDFSSVEGKKVLVHGGGRRATKVAAQLGIETKMVNGRRITDHCNHFEHVGVGDTTAIHHFCFYTQLCCHLGGTTATTMHKHFFAFYR